MTEFAPVAPLEVHKALHETGDLGTYQLLLAHEVLAEPQAYYEFWRDQIDQTIIMDNSLIELGHPMKIEKVMEAASIVGGDTSIVVLPDVLGDRIGTMALVFDALEELDDTEIPDLEVKTLAVAQGATPIDTFSCARDLIQLGVDYVSIPRRLADGAGSRLWAARTVAAYHKPIHLLGFSDNNWDDIVTAGVAGVVGIDSAVPIWLGLQGRLLPPEPEVAAHYGKRPETYPHTKKITPEVIQNVRTVRRWLERTAKVAPIENPQAPSELKGT